jgi:hypothetical protein
VNPQSFEYGPTQITFTVILSVAVFLYYSITASRIFGKAGLKAWQGWVPFLNSWRLLQLGGRSGWWLLAVLIPVVGQIVYLIVYYMAQYRIGRGFGKSGAFVLWAILLSPVWFGILAFGSSTWSGDRPSTLPRQNGSSGSSATATKINVR